MSICRLLVVLVVMSIVGFAPAPLPRREVRQRADPTDVRGTWTIELWESRGSSNDGSARQYTIEMDKDKYDFVTVNGGGRTHYDMKLHTDQRPYAFEWSMGGRIMYAGSYRLEGEKMTMIFKSSSQIGDRPMDFNDPKPEFRFVMRRTSRK